MRVAAVASGWGGIRLDGAVRLEAAHRADEEVLAGVALLAAFQEHDVCVRQAGAQPGRHDAAGRAAADDDVVGDAGAIGGLRSRRAEEAEEGEQHQECSEAHEGGRREGGEDVDSCRPRERSVRVSRAPVEGPVHGETVRRHEGAPLGRARGLCSVCRRCLVNTGHRG